MRWGCEQGEGEEKGRKGDGARAWSSVEVDEMKEREERGRKAKGGGGESEKAKEGWGRREGKGCTSPIFS